MNLIIFMSQDEIKQKLIKLEEKLVLSQRDYFNNCISRDTVTNRDIVVEIDKLEQFINYLELQVI